MNSRLITNTENTADREIVTTRIINAPRELVFEAWSDPDHVTNWWGPRGFTTTTHHMDLRPGGEWRFIMHGPDGRDYPNRIVYREIVKHERLVYDHHGDASEPIHFHVTVTFEKHGAAGKATKLTLRSVFPTADERNRVVDEVGAIEGANQTLARFAEHLATKAVEVSDSTERPFIISRLFDVPRDMMFKAWTESKHLERWWGPKGFKAHVAKLDLRPGGILHYRLQSPEGKEMWGKFVYREIVAPEKLVFVSSFSDEHAGITRHPMAPGWPAEVLSTMTFADYEVADGRCGTMVIGHAIPINATEAERKLFQDSHASMRGGWTGTFDQLADYLK